RCTCQDTGALGAGLLGLLLLGLLSACKATPQSASTRRDKAEAIAPSEGSKGTGAGDDGCEHRARRSSLVQLRVQVHQSYPHDTHAFTQGLLWYDGHLYESVGRYGHSALRKVELSTGKVLHQVPLADHLFAEGLARVGDELIQLTWREHKALRWSIADKGFKRLGAWQYGGEGWGLCAMDDGRLVMSDGSAQLSFRDSRDFEVQRSLRVYIESEDPPMRQPISRLNELACVHGKVYANVWQEERIVRLDPHSGEVEAVIDASGLLTDSERQGVDVLNGIAWLPKKRRFLLTGKLWPKIFEVSFVPK
ncbi:MAG: glutaminyl-peptide cyclotransferase, partial [Polyangiales bacterium]